MCAPTGLLRWALIATSLGWSKQLHAQCPDGSPPPCSPSARSPRVPNSVAVLYFESLSPDTADAYLAEGLTDEIIARLGQVERLAVKSRTAVRRYRATPLDATTLGQALGVAHLVNGSVRRAGNRLRVTVELVRALSGDRVWGQQYDRTDSDLLAIEEEIATSVVTAIVGRLLPRERAELAARSTLSPAAYAHFLRGNYHFARRNQRAVALAIQEYSAAVSLDPTFVDALARIGMSFGQMLDWDWSFGGLPRDSLLARGSSMVDRALRQDSTSSDAWVARGYLLSFGLPRTREAVEQAFTRAVAFNPRNAEALTRYGVFLNDFGHDAGAATAFHQSLAIEPERAITLWCLGTLQFQLRRYAEAQRWMDSAVTVDPALYQGYADRARIRAQLGDTAGARADAETAISLAPPEDRLYGGSVLALLQATAGDTVAARANVERLLEDVAERQNSSVLWPGMVLIALGERPRFFALVEKMRWREPGFWSNLRAPEFDPVRDDPRFRRLLEQAQL